jgi:hypothetical protein
MLLVLIILAFCILTNLYIRYKKKVPKQYLVLQNSKYKWLIVVITLVAILSILFGISSIYCLSWLIFLQLLDIVSYVRKDNKR